MIATEHSVVRAASISMVLAAMALFGLDQTDEEVRVTHCTGQVVLPEVPAVRLDEGVLRPSIDGAWQGICHEGEKGWPDMPVTLAFTRANDGTMTATGTLSFVDRKTRATLHGAGWDGHFRLHGTMTEIGGLGTDWAIEVRAETVGAGHIRGRFIEVYPPSLGGSGAVMCTFDWQR